MEIALQHIDLCVNGILELSCLHLTELPPYLTSLSCSSNQLSALPELPNGLNQLYCSYNQLLFLPELPSTLEGFTCILPYNDEIYIPNEMTPEIVQQLNRENQEWMAQNKKRCMERCSQYKEQIMMKAWHPSRVAMMYEMGYDVEDM